MRSQTSQQCLQPGFHFGTIETRATIYGAGHWFESIANAMKKIQGGRIDYNEQGSITVHSSTPPAVFSRGPSHLADSLDS